MEVCPVPIPAEKLHKVLMSSHSQLGIHSSMTTLYVHYACYVHIMLCRHYDTLLLPAIFLPRQLVTLSTFITQTLTHPLFICMKINNTNEQKTVIIQLLMRQLIQGLMPMSDMPLLVWSNRRYRCLYCRSAGSRQERDELINSTQYIMLKCLD